MSFKSVKKIVSKFVLAMLLSSSFSLNGDAIGKVQEMVMKDWLEHQGLNVEEGMKKLQYAAKDGTPCYLVPIYENDEVEKFIVDLYSNQAYKDYMYNWFGGKGMSTQQKARSSKFDVPYLNMHNSKDPRVNAHEYFDGYLSRSVNFVIFYGDFLAGQLSMGPMRNLGVPSEVAVVIHKKYSGKGIFSGLSQIDMGFFMNAYKNGTKNASRNLSRIYTTPSKPQATSFMGRVLSEKFGFYYDEKLTSQKKDGCSYYYKVI